MFTLPAALRSFFSGSELPAGSPPVPAGLGMDLHSGEPWWAQRTTEHAAYPVLEEDLRTDVVIVGGGITGALCAYTFAQAGIATVVVDGRALGMGSTCASTALLQYEIDTPLHVLVDLVGERNAVRSYRLCARAVERLAAIAGQIGVNEFHLRPSLQYASRRSHVSGLVKEHGLRQANGLPCTLLDDARDVRAALNFDAPAALRSDLGAEMDALRFTHALHASSMRNGARVYEHTAVVDFRDNGSGIELRTVNGHHIRARDLVHATGYGSRDSLPKDLIRLQSTYALVSEVIDAGVPWPDQALIWETASPYRYLRSTPDGRVIMGGRDVPFRSPNLRDALLDTKTKALEQDFACLYPDVPFRTAHAWCGTFGSTKDGLPYIDHGPRDPHSYFALGMGGNGITFSMIAAEILCDRILGRPNQDSGIFRFDR